MTKRILVVDDEPSIREIVRIAIEAAGMEVIEAPNGKVALTHLDREKPDLVVLDIGMPQMDGHTFCKVVRTRSRVPILLLTARADEIDRVLSFELGADDFLAKPFSTRELVLRIKAILARVDPEPALDDVLRHGTLELNKARHSCLLNGADLGLTAREFDLLAALAERPEQVLDRNRLISSVYGHNIDLSGRTIDSHIRNLRGKAAEVGCDDLIVTVHGVGVRLGACGG